MTVFTYLTLRHETLRPRYNADPAVFGHLFFFLLLLHNSKNFWILIFISNNPSYITTLFKTTYRNHSNSVSIDMYWQCIYDTYTRSAKCIIARYTPRSGVYLLDTSRVRSTRDVSLYNPECEARGFIQNYHWARGYMCYIWTRDMSSVYINLPGNKKRVYEFWGKWEACIYV